MAILTKDGKRIEPYKSFKFIVKWAGKTEAIAGVSKISALSRKTQAIEFRSGGDGGITYSSPGQTKYEPITLERGKTENAEFQEWANRVASLEKGVALSASSDQPFRKDLDILLHDEAGQAAKTYRVYGCWVSEYQALPELDATSNSIAIEKIVLQHNGWEEVK